MTTPPITDDLISFFGLHGDPFGPVRDSAELFEAESQAQVVDQVLTDVATDPGVVTVRGHRGVGKTSISQLIALALRRHGVLAVELTGGRQNPLQIQTLIGQAAGIGAAERLTPDQLARELPSRLGQNGIVLVIDDTQHLSEAEYRYLLLLRAALGFTRIGFGLIMVGSAGQWPVMDTTDLRTLWPDNVARHIIFPLREAEAPALLQHRFRSAGRPVTDVLTPAALRALVQEAEGMPGQLAALTRAAMAAAYARRRRRVTLRTLWPSLSADSGRGKLVWLSLRVPAIAAACLLLAAAAGTGYVLQQEPGGLWRTDLQEVRVQLAAGLDTVVALVGLDAPIAPPSPVSASPAVPAVPALSPRLQPTVPVRPRIASIEPAAPPAAAPDAVPPSGSPFHPSLGNAGAVPPASMTIPAPPEPSGGTSRFDPIQSTSLPPPARPQTRNLPPPIALSQAAAVPVNPVVPPRSSPGLILVAGADDTLPALYARVYRGVTPPPYSDVLAANHSPVRPGDLLIFPEPPNGWSRR